MTAARYVDSSEGVRIATYEEGNPDGPTLVLTHGWPDSHALWDGVVPLLTEKFRRRLRRRHRRAEPRRTGARAWP
jgi:pimeloyl-ACP methyl ester carboxylesterase